MMSCQKTSMTLIKYYNLKKELNTTKTRMKMKQSSIEWLLEGWVKFRRHNCKEGFIDVWHGDSVDNPCVLEKVVLLCADVHNRRHRLLILGPKAT